LDWHDSTTWLAVGLIGNAIFFSRFLIQWLASEKAGRSVVPTVFWHLSIWGSIVLLLYALHKRDPVFILAFLPNVFVYLRNLHLIRREKAGDPEGPTDLARGAERRVVDARS
jgi:lipid-A-disaccharide synthase-like uncharacterized protein